MVSSAYSEVAEVTGARPDKKFDVPPRKTSQILLTVSKNRREVVGTCDCNDTMSRWSDQLLLAAENGHFEGSMLLKEMEGVMSRFCQGVVIF